MNEPLPSYKTYSLDKYQSLAQFLRDEKAATVALPINGGDIHAASLLYLHTTDPLRFYFVTSRQSEKCQQLAQVGAVNGACVVGTYKGTPFTLQMRGRFTIVEPADYQEIIDQYYQKRGSRHDDINDPKNSLIQFEPNWARFTDYSKDYARFYLGL